VSTDERAGALERRRLERSLEQSRERLGDAVSELREAAHEALTLGEIVSRHRYVWLGAAVILGLWMGRAGNGGGDAAGRD
jgi:hypothetical protein